MSLAGALVVVLPPALGFLSTVFVSPLSVVVAAVVGVSVVVVVVVAEFGADDGVAVDGVGMDVDVVVVVVVVVVVLWSGCDGFCGLSCGESWCSKYALPTPLHSPFLVAAVNSNTISLVNFGLFKLMAPFVTFPTTSPICAHDP